MSDYRWNSTKEDGRIQNTKYRLQNTKYRMKNTNNTYRFTIQAKLNKKQNTQYKIYILSSNLCLPVCMSDHK